MLRIKQTHKKLQFRYKGLFGILCAFLLIAGILFAERSGIRYSVSNISNAYLPPENNMQAEQVHKSLDNTCLILTNSEDANSKKALKELRQIMLDMKIGYDIADITHDNSYNFSNYETVIVAVPNISPMKTKILELSDWVKDGGNAMFSMTLEQETYSKLIDPKLGIISSGWENIEIDGYYPHEDFMLGGGINYPVSSTFKSSRPVELSKKAKVHVRGESENGAPLIWEHPYGNGKFVVVNMGIYEKTVRGFYAAAYSLMTDCSVYPVINGAAFYLEAFPSPASVGISEYTESEYDLSLEDFYSQIWWQDMINLSSEYDIKYTGSMIENYSNDTTGKTVKQENTKTFNYYGNMLLYRKGEIAYHGYNSHPYCLDNTDYHGLFPYKTWKDEIAMENTMKELIGFSNEVFPNMPKSVYAPPSNILSHEGREMISSNFPEIKTIAGYYLPGDLLYHQEFEVAHDGIVEQPRLTSGYTVDDYMMMTALSELNMHLVNNHFLRPEDFFYDDSSNEPNWEKSSGDLENYMQWLYTSAPQIAPLTASQLSGRIQRFAAVSAEKVITDTAVNLKIHNLYDSAYFMVRFNEGEPGAVTGGKLEHMTGNLYLLHAESENVKITISR